MDEMLDMAFCLNKHETQMLQYTKLIYIYITVGGYSITWFKSTTTLHN